MVWKKICETNDVDDKKVINVNDKEILIIKKDDGYFGLSNKCPHMGGSLGDGFVDEDGYVSCPLHYWQFSHKDGKAPPGYEDSTPKIELKIENKEIFVDTEQLDKIETVKEKHDSKERFERAHDDFEKEYEGISNRAKWRSNSIQPMRTQKPVIGFDDILFKAAQLDKFPLFMDEKVVMETVIGKKVKKPLKMKMPVFVSHMSYGALSEEMKMTLAAGAKKLGIAIGSGEGGRNQKEFDNAGSYIYEIGTQSYAFNEKWIKEADAVEIKIGQSAKPGLGGHLPKGKITEEIAKVRGISMEENFISPSRFIDIKNKEDMKLFIEKIRKFNDGPIGIKFAAGNVEKDIDFALYAKPDFITIDGRPGGTGAAPTFVKDNFSMPTIYALARARKYLDKIHSDVDLIITGGFRTSGDVTKALSMGADAVALATASMIAGGCQQYRTCNSGNCPVGIATQDLKLRGRFCFHDSLKRLVNFYEVLGHEIEEITRAIGKDNVHKLDYEDIMTTNNEISSNTVIEHC